MPVFRSAFYLSVVCAAVCIPLGVAKDKHAPLPTAILIAKTIYIDNQSGFANMGDRAYDELSKWGRYQVVDSATKADLVLLLSANAYDGGYVSSGSHNTYGSVSDSGDVNLYGSSTSTTSHVTVHYSHLTIINPKDGASLWSDQKKWGWHSATRGLIKELRNRVEEQEKEKPLER
jgi:hypothetical protein